jgi:catechol 2,3-dioxygenase
MGHVHLHVGDIALADAFYRGGLGLDVMTRRYPGALFLGAGGYHHHLGANTWAGPTATSPGPDEAQLLAWTMTVPEAASVAALAADMTANGFTSSSSPDGALVARDPWGTVVEVSSVV